MSKPIPTLGYPSRTAAVMALKKKGYPEREIAERIGIPIERVSALAISGRKAKKYDGSVARPERTILLSAADYRSLSAPAAERGITVIQLVNRLLTVLVDDDLVNVVLDDAFHNELGA